MTASAADLAHMTALLLDTFREETRDGLDQLESRLLELTEQSGPGRAQLIDQLFRAVHTIKGGAGTFGMTAMARLAHRMESVLDTYRGGAPPSAAAVTTLLEASDALRALLGEGPNNATERYRKLELRLEQPADPDAPMPRAPRPVARHTIRVAPAPELFRAGIDPALLFNQLTALGALHVAVDTSAVPALAELEPTDCHLAWTLTLTGSTAEMVQGLFDWVSDVCPVEIATAAGAAAGAGFAAPVAPVAHEPVGRDPSASIRVRLDKLDGLMKLIGDLVITQSTLCTLDRAPENAEDRSRTRGALDELQRLTRGLQQTALQLRSMPVSSVLQRFPRLVRDLAEHLGKQVALEITGDATELDKTVLERIGDPLVHLIRNSLDHGIELPDVREAAGKPRAGRIRIAVEQRGDEVTIAITDDGKGLDAGKILARARQRGLIAPDRTPPEDEVHRLILLPGFSTAEQVSELSGRGVGMDVVARTLQDLGGDLRLRSQPGAGMTITLRLPLTLAIIDGQLVRCGGRSWVVPLAHVVECSQLDPGAVTRLLGQRPVYQVGDDIVPVIDLCAELALPRDGEHRVVLVVEAKGERRALLIDDIGVRQQIVIKSLAAQLARTDYLAGATVLGDGSVAFILDIASLCAKRSERAAA